MLSRMVLTPIPRIKPMYAATSARRSGRPRKEFQSLDRDYQPILLETWPLGMCFRYVLQIWVAPENNRHRKQSTQKSHTPHPKSHLPTILVVYDSILGTCTLARNKCNSGLYTGYCPGVVIGFPVAEFFASPWPRQCRLVNPVSLESEKGKKRGRDTKKREDTKR